MKYAFLIVINILLTGLVKGQDTYVLYKGRKTYHKKSVLMFYDLKEGWELKETDDQIIFIFDDSNDDSSHQLFVHLKSQYKYQAVKEENFDVTTLKSFQELKEFENIRIQQHKEQAQEEGEVFITPLSHSFVDVYIVQRKEGYYKIFQVNWETIGF
ncbi:hypothetical protein [Echinicola sp. 20G]|uniref:hypothetical protein n=1 Tax=Echinicola sp. 20G TaxID=2781961 RepID=UPI00191047DC|nr:hypothetical protein [Echinicola sp. 20G]